ncbi:formate dehydrogenase [Azospirillum griseum]|nr:formate dehydrogenase [Azospirillum griseum]
MTERHRADKPNGAMARRDLFRVAGLGVGALGAAAVGAVGAAPTAEAAPTAPATTGYRETDHVRTVYALSRF